MPVYIYVCIMHILYRRDQKNILLASVDRLSRKLMIVCARIRILLLYSRIELYYSRLRLVTGSFLLNL